MLVGGIPDPVKHRVPVPAPSTAPGVGGKLLLREASLLCAAAGAGAVASQSRALGSSLAPGCPAPLPVCAGSQQLLEPEAVIAGA